MQPGGSGAKEQLGSICAGLVAAWRIEARSTRLLRGRSRISCTRPRATTCLQAFAGTNRHTRRWFSEGGESGGNKAPFLWAQAHQPDRPECELGVTNLRAFAIEIHRHAGGEV